jgi:ABC-type glycerol-3-phosphate transport system substrate-binding protein
MDHVMDGVDQRAANSKSANARRVSRRSFLQGTLYVGAAALGTGLLAACAPAAPSASTSAGSTSAAAPAAGPAQRGSVTLTHWSFPLTQDDAALFRPMVKAFSKENPSISVDVQILPWAGRAEKMTAAVAANNPPDVVYLNPDFYPRFVEAGQLTPLDPFLSGGFQDDFLPGPLGAVTYNNATFGVPVLTSVFTNLGSGPWGCDTTGPRAGH